ncbi:MAG: hypothetical protein ABIE70_12630 [bacterium]
MRITKRTYACLAVLVVMIAVGCEVNRGTNPKGSVVRPFPVPAWGNIALSPGIVGGSGVIFEDIRRAYAVTAAQTWNRSLFVDTVDWKDWTGNWPGWSASRHELPDLALSPADDSIAQSKDDGNGTLIRTYKRNANYQFWKISYVDSTLTDYRLIDAIETVDGKAGWVSFVPHNDSGYYEWEWWFEVGQQTAAMIFEGRLHTVTDSTIVARIVHGSRGDGQGQMSFLDGRPPDLWQVGWADSTASTGVCYWHDPESETGGAEEWTADDQSFWRTGWDDHLDPAWYELNDDWRTLLGL